MKNQLLNLQSQRDSLRAKLQAKSRFGQFDNEWDELHKSLGHLDLLFSRLCQKHNFELGKFGRLSL
jgi:hypothetical protein